MIIELSIDKLHTYVKSSKSCNVDSFRCDLESVYGQIKFGFKQQNLRKIDIVFRKISGNGKVIISCNDISYRETIHSKVSHTISIDLNGPCDVALSRGPDGLGVLQILGINLYIEDDVIGDDMPANKWKSILFGVDYSQLRVIEESLFASIGSYISADSVAYINTDPPNMCRMDCGRFKFIGQCEITDIIKNDGISMPEKDVVVATVTAGEEDANMIYDSNSNKFNNAKTNQDSLSKVIVGSDGSSYLTIKRFGSASISISALKPMTKYLVILSAKKLTGNGELKVGIGNKLEPVAVENKFVDKFVRLTTDDSDGNLKLNVLMTDSGNGEVVISRIRISEDFTVSNTIQPVLKKYFTVQPISGNQSKLVPSKINKFFNPKTNATRKFVIVIPSYNNHEWTERTIKSALNQNYDNYRIIFIDDCSKDDTFEVTKNIVESSSKKSIVTLIRNDIRIGALENLYNAIHSCADDEIVLTLDGDDWLAGNGVLKYLNNIYAGQDVWMTYGQYRNHPDGGIGIAKQIPEKIIKSSGHRSYDWCASHLRTFYAWLFKQIKKEDLMYNGRFMQMTWDLAIMFPQLEMAGPHSKFISETLYIYNLENPINDHKVNRKLQADLDKYVRRLPKYPPVELSNVKQGQKKIGLLIIATNKYDQFVNQLISSADRYFFDNDSYDVSYFVFTDSDQEIVTNRNVVKIDIEHKPFPYASMDRFKHFVNNKDKLKEMDYLFYVDVDCAFVDNVGEDVLGELVGVQHCGFVGTKNGPFEDNPKSAIYVNPSSYSTYYGGGFSGGSRDKYLELAKWCDEMIDKDQANNIMPRFHDESVINRYFLDNKPDLTLSPSYHYPQGNKDHYKRIWGSKTFKPKILLLDKNHKEVR